jgi:signal transduction histidine kinase/ActR/RegA family two-component response regulator
MATPLRVLMVEDCEDDAELLLAELRRSDLEIVHRRVFSERDLRSALREEVWDAILSDYSLPQFDAHGVLRVVKELGLDVPVLVVSGTLDEEAAVTLLRSGAQDFIVKNRLARLCPAIAREVREAKLRKEQRQLREQLMITDRMASMGALAAGVAHEINNPLGVLLGTLEFIQGAVDKSDQAKGDVLPPKFKAFLADACEAAERIRQIARDITTFSRSDSSVMPTPIDLAQVMASSLRMAKPQIRHRAKVVEDIAALPPVLAPEGRLGQLFLNLLVNAAQAIPEGGYERNEIRITARVLADQRIELAVSDTGCGIAPEHLSRIFDPFFTTKPHGIGTGLGLPICKRIVTDLGGELVAESVLGRGTTFRVTLPAMRAERSTFSRRAAAPAVPTAPRGRVLIVDDERMTVSLTERMLVGEHDVLGITDPDEALQLITSEHFDVILCDIDMPHVSGPALLEAARKVAPRLASKFVFMAGPRSAGEGRVALDGIPNPVLDKPFEAQRLLAVINTSMMVQREAMAPAATPVLPWSVLKAQVGR